MTKEELLAKKVCLISLGCDKNTVDSERILYNINQFGFGVTPNAHEAQIIIVNTCAFIEPARLESIDKIKEVLQYKNKTAEKIIVVGCLPAKSNFDFKNVLPGVDLTLGTRSYEEIISAICKLYNIVPKQNKNNSPCARIVSTPRHYAYLKIADGCDNKCSYCTIPQIRGRYKSEPLEKLLAEATELAKQGVKELILVAQDVTRYGEDLYKKHRIVELVQELSKIEGIQWIRLHYCYPEFFSEQLINEMATNPRVCKYVDIPIQHINDDILKSMNRASTYKRVVSLLSKLKQKMPDVSIRTSIIVGFPGEDNARFKQLEQFLTEYKLDNVGFFAYSKEYDTVAYNLKHQVPESTKQKRLNKLVQIQADIQYNKCKQLLNKTLTCICDDETADYYIMRTQYSSPEIDNFVYVKKDNVVCHIGEFYNVKMVDVVEPFDLKGEII